MARKKSADDMTAVNFRCSADLKSDLEELAYLSRRDLSSILVELCEGLVAANKTKIINSRRRKPPAIILPTFAAPTTTNTPTAPTSKNAAQVVNTGTPTIKGGDSE